MIEIDGSMGEGGGQVLRSALSLSCLTGRAFRIVNIRKRREKPGLMRQHLMAVQSAARVSGADVEGDRLGSAEVTFIPGAIRPGTYSFDIGTAGAATLVLQTLIPPLAAAPRPSAVSVVGGTHVPFSPSWNYFAEIFWPIVTRLGVKGELSLHAFGFYPRGGGKITCRFPSTADHAPLTLLERGRLLRITGSSAVGNLPLSIAERQAGAALHLLRERLGADVPVTVTPREVRVFGQGTFVFLRAVYEHAVAGFTVLGERGKLAERVGEEAALELLEHDETRMPVDKHLADQLILYLAQARQPSRFATSCITTHLQTNLQVAGMFLDITTGIEGNLGEPGTVTIHPGGSLS